MDFWSKAKNIPGNKNNSSKGLEVGDGIVCLENTVFGNNWLRQERARSWNKKGLLCHASVTQNHRRVLDSGADRSDLNFIKIILATR